MNVVSSNARILSLTILLIFPVGSASAEVLEVPEDFASIQEAMDAAAVGDTIRIAAGTFTEFDLRPGAKSLTIRGTRNTSGELVSTIDAQQAGSVFRLEAGETTGTVIRDLIITGGLADSGGGFFCDGAAASILDCLIENNTATSGAGIALRDGAVTVVNCTIRSNTANRGTAIYSDAGNPVIRGCLISDNVGDSSAAGVYFINGGGPLIEDCEVRDNQARRATGIRCDNTDAIIRRCLVSGNLANGTPGAGAGILLISSSPFIEDCTIEDNQADLGGGLYAASLCAPLVLGTSITGNSATTAGGGLYGLSSSETTFANSRICGNSPQQTVGPVTELSGNWVLPTCPTCPGDVDGDEVVDVGDLLFLISVWDEANPSADFDADGVVETDDLLLLLARYGTPCR